MKMRIALDCRTIKPWVTGLGQYAYALIHHLAALDQENEYIILKSPLMQQRLVVQDNFRELTLPGSPENVRNVCGHLSILDRENVDIFHSLYHFLPRSVRARHLCITCHDLIWIDYPQLAFADFWRKWGIKIWGTLAIDRALRQADAVICISQATRAAVARRIPTPKLHVIYQGAEPLWHSTTPPHANDSVFTLPTHPYFLMVGHTKPYKNAPFMIRTFAHLIQDQPHVQLIFVGRGDNYQQLQHFVRQLHLEQQVHFLPLVSSAQLTALYQNACALVQPSLIEGCGRPIIEAMRVGCPVIGANRSSLPELVGDAGLLADPQNSAAWVKAMTRMITESDFRAECIARGNIQVQKFTWQSTAQHTLDLYRSLIDTSGR